MSTYYKYAERDDDSQIDWSVIGKDINKKLDAEVERRDKLKAKIETESLEYAEKLKETPVGADSAASNNAIAFTNDAAEYKLGLTKSLKFGNMNVKKYLQATNNLRIDTEGAFVMYENYQKYNDQKIARMDSSDPSKRGNVLESALYKHTGGYMNMRNSRPFIDPITGRVLFARQGKDGKQLIGEEGQYPPISIPMMNNYITSEIASFDVDKAVEETTASIGDAVVSVSRLNTQTGARFWDTIKITDKTEALLKQIDKLDPEFNDIDGLKAYVEKYAEARDAKVDYYMGNDNNVVDYLVRMGIGYDTTFDEKDFKEDGKMILIKQDPETEGFELVFPKDAKDVAKQALSDAIDAKQSSAFETTSKQVYEKPVGEGDKQYLKEKAKARGDLKTYNSWIEELIHGTPAQKRAALQKFANKDPNDVVEELYFKLDPNTRTANIVAVLDDGRGGTYEKTLINNWEASTNRDIADAFLWNEIFPTLGSGTADYYEDLYKELKIDKIEKRPAYQYEIDPDTKKPLTTYDTSLYDETKEEEWRVGSTRREYPIVPLSEASLYTIKGVTLVPKTTWSGKTSAIGGSAANFERVFDYTWKSKFADEKKRADQNVLNKIGMKINRVENAYYQLGNIATGSEWQLVELQIDPKYGEPLLLTVDAQVTPNMDEIIDEIERRYVAGEEIKMDDKMISIWDPTNATKLTKYVAAYKDPNRKNVKNALTVKDSKYVDKRRRRSKSGGTSR